MAKLEITYTISPTQRVRLGYRPAFTSLPFTYISPFLTYDQSPYIIDNIEEGSWEVELTTASSGCTITPCGTPVRVVATAGDPNTIHSQVQIGIDSNSNVYFSVTFSEVMPSSVTISGTYTIGGNTTPYSVIVPSNISAYNKLINTTTFTSVDSYCYTTISPSVVNNKNVTIDNILPC